MRDFFVVTEILHDVLEGEGKYFIFVIYLCLLRLFIDYLNE